jgi:hypothetical protein
VEKVQQGPEKVVTNTSANGGWLMLSGVELGMDKRTAAQVEILASSKQGGKLEIWLDDLATGKLAATIAVTATGGETNWKIFRSSLKNLSGHHDVFVKFPAGSDHTLFINTIRFLPAK